MLLKSRSHRFFPDAKLLSNYPGSGNPHISLMSERIAGEEGYEALDLAVARHRLGDHRVHVKSTEERFLIM